MGVGVKHTFGYKQSIFNHRAYLSVNYSMGFYSSRWFLDADKEYFNSLHLSTAMHYDLIRYSIFSLQFYGGVSLNNMRGLVGGGYRFNEDNFEQNVVN